MSNPKRFHPIAIVQLWFRYVRRILLLTFFTLLNQDSSLAEQMLILLGIAVVLFILAFVKYWTQTYELSVNKLAIRKGLFRRSEIDIPYLRMQSIRKQQWFYMKPFDLMSIQVETAGGDSGETEATLLAVKQEVLDELERYRLGERSDQLNREDQAERKVELAYKVSSRSIFIFALTDLSAIGSLILALFFLYEYIPETWISESLSFLGQLVARGIYSTLLVTVVFLMIGVLLSLLRTLSKFYRFQVSRTGDTLVIESGLFQRNVRHVPVSKVQGIQIRQSILRRLFHIVSVEMILAGGSSGDEQVEDSKVYLLPIAGDKEMSAVFTKLIPEWAVGETELRSESNGTFYYFLRFPLLLSLLFVSLTPMSKWFLLVAAVGTMVSLLAAWIDTRFQGYSFMDSNRVCMQTVRFITVVRTYLDRSKIQSYSERTSRLLLKKNRFHVTLFYKEGTSGTAVQLRYLPRQTTQRLIHFLNPKRSDRF